MNLLRHITWEQPDYMWQYQLKNERDVIAQSEVGILGLWLRMDPSMNFLRHITWEQPDYMWQYQLKYEQML